MKNIPILPQQKFKIAGKLHNDADNETIKAISELEKLDNVEFVGYLNREEVQNFFIKAVLLLNTSHFEGFSNTFLEAWSFGVPVVSTKNVNPDGIISKYNLGKISESYEDLLNCLNDILNLPDKEYNDLSINCHNYVKKYHDPKVLASKFVDFLKIT